MTLGNAQPFRHLLESVQAIEDDQTTPLPVVLPLGQSKPRVARAAIPLPVRGMAARPHTFHAAPVSAPVARPTSENLLVTQSSRVRLADAPSTDVDQSAETADKVSAEQLAEDALDAAPKTKQDWVFDISMQSLDTPLEDDSLNTRLAALPLLRPLDGGTDGLVVARGESTSTWQRGHRGFGDDSFNHLLAGPDDWFDVNLAGVLDDAPDEVSAPLDERVRQVPTVDIRPLPARAISGPQMPLVRGELVITTPVRLPRPRRPIAPTVPTPAPQMEVPPPPGAAPKRSARPAAPADTPPHRQRRPVRDAAEASSAPPSRAEADREKLALQFYHAAVTAIAARKYADALARLAGAHNIDPENTRYLAMIEDVKAMMQRAA